MKYIILDFETTGYKPATAEIIEIGAIAVDGLKETARYQTLVRPSHQIPPAISLLTGITNEEVQDAPTLDQVLPGFIEFLGNLPIVAHNASMEQDFLDVYVAPKSVHAPYRVLNSIDPIALVLPERASFSLESLRKTWQIDSTRAHRADDDCVATLEVLRQTRLVLEKKRPHIASIVLGQLSHKEWFWNWFFEEIERPTQGHLADLGDLKEYRNEDSEREFDWDQKINPSEIHHALKDAGQELQYRKSQETMAWKVAEAFNEGAHAAIEAPTGTGKSIAYLLPGILHVEKTGAPLVIATHSKSLQDQLLEKDIPKLARVLGRDSIQATTVKGQENYLCLRKLNEASAMARDLDDEEGETDERWALAYLMAHAASTHTVELDRTSRYLRNQSPSLETLIERVRSQFSTTKGPGCPFYQQCHFYNSARKAHQAQVIIANHALAFSWPQALPKVRNIVFDEAHHLEDQITQAFSVHVSEFEILSHTERLMAPRARGRRGKNDWKHLEPFFQEPDAVKLQAEKIKSTLSDLRPLLSTASRGSTEAIIVDRLSGPVAENVNNALKNLTAALVDFSLTLTHARDQAEDTNLKERRGFDLLKTYLDAFTRFAKALQSLGNFEDQNLLRLIYWNPNEKSWKLAIHPIEVKALSKPLLGQMRSIVMTSATLSVAQNPNFLLERIGMELPQPLISLPSPFDLAAQAVVYIPKGTPPPGSPDHLIALIQMTANIARTLGGRTLLLMTANSRLKAASAQLSEILEPEGISVFDSLSDSRAVDSFKNTERALLIGSERYGEGLDIPGRQLTCVILEKINEAMTRGPLSEARKARVKSALFHFDFPMRMIWLKQRVGRLIRSPSDTGFVVILDSRYHGWSSENSRDFVNQTIAPMHIQAGTIDKVLEEIGRSGW